TGEATRFLQQGVANNPADWQMQYDMAMTYAWYRKDARDALPYALRSQQLATDPFYKHRVGLLCNTLRTDIKTGRPARPI
ncbi:MAG: hypothetical protein JOZ51_01250, partial [Chloroflexi bacterium]|nr:hypothetical protein [Chloroflexota bacterium]